LVAGDIVASEHAGKTLKMILTRSLRRGQILTGKTLASFTYVVATTFVLGAAGLIAGSAAWGFNPLTNLSGVRVAALHTLWLSVALRALSRGSARARLRHVQEPRRRRRLVRDRPVAEQRAEACQRKPCAHIDAAEDRRPQPAPAHRDRGAENREPSEAAEADS